MDVSKDIEPELADEDDGVSSVPLGATEPIDDDSSGSADSWNERIKQRSAAQVANAAECETARTFTILLEGESGLAQIFRPTVAYVITSCRLGIAWQESTATCGLRVLHLGHWHPCLKIIRVETKGLIQKWNKRNPDKHVTRWSRIVEVNGERGDCRRLSSLLLSSCELSVVVIPKSALSSSA